MDRQMRNRTLVVFIIVVILTIMIMGNFGYIQHDIFMFNMLAGFMGSITATMFLHYYS